jgi:hypothetical protein
MTPRANFGVIRGTPPPRTLTPRRDVCTKYIYEGGPTGTKKQTFGTERSGREAAVIGLIGRWRTGSNQYSALLMRKVL